jgi:hypothetical protein
MGAPGTGTTAGRGTANRSGTRGGSAADTTGGSTPGTTGGTAPATSGTSGTSAGSAGATGSGGARGRLDALKRVPGQAWATGTSSQHVVYCGVRHCCFMLQPRAAPPVPALATCKVPRP